MGEEGRALLRSCFGCCSCCSCYCCLLVSFFYIVVQLIRNSRPMSYMLICILRHHSLCSLSSLLSPHTFKWLPMEPQKTLGPCLARARIEVRAFVEDASA